MNFEHYKGASRGLSMQYMPGDTYRLEEFEECATRLCDCGDDTIYQVPGGVLTARVEEAMVEILEFKEFSDWDKVLSC